MTDKVKIICLVDGEHYLPVTKSAVDLIKESEENDVLGMIFIGGTEKLRNENPEEYSKLMETPVFFGKDKYNIPYDLIIETIKKYDVDKVIDLSDEPILDYSKRFQIACKILPHGVIYEGPDFRFDPLTQHDVLEKPSFKIIGTGKRIGKTAVSTFASRLINKKGYNPCVVAMGRGGPEEPEIVHGEKIEITPEYLMEQSNKGVHAASDHWEDALMSRVLTIGCRRCGGGMSGEVFLTNIKKGASLTNQLDSEFVIVEGSGAAVPPIKTDKTILLLGAGQPIETIKNYFGPMRIGLADLVIITMCEEPISTTEKVQEIIDVVKKENPNVTIVKTVFRPKPLKSIKNKKVLFATTAPEIIKDVLVSYLERKYSCEIVGTTPHLSDRVLLKKDLERFMDKTDVVLTELKAAAVDVVTKNSLEAGLEVVYCDNIPLGIDGTVCLLNEDYEKEDEFYCESTTDNILNIAKSSIKHFNL